MYFLNEKLVYIDIAIINKESILYDYFCIGTCRRRHVRIKLNRTCNISFKIWDKKSGFICKEINPGRNILS